MDELRKFVGILKRYLLVIIIVPLLTVIVTYFLVRNLPSNYASDAQIATGIVDETKQYQQLSILNQSVLQGQQITQEFSNLMSMMRLKRVLDQVSYTLILNDLTSSKPLKAKSKLFGTLDKYARTHAISVYKQLYDQKKPLDLSNNDQLGLNEVLKSMKYDSESLNGSLNIFRSGDSDFITIQATSESPDLSAAIVNSLSSEFITYYSGVVRTNKIKATNFLGSLLKEKGDSLANRMASLKNYKIKNRVLNLDEQSKQLYQSIVEYDNKKQEAIQNTSSYAGALNEIDRKFDPNERRYLEATLSKVNLDIIDTKQELSAMYDMYYGNDMDDKYKGSIDSLDRKLTSEIHKSSDQYITNPLATKQSLVTQKIDLEIKLDISRYSINALERKLNTLNSEFDRLVPKEAEVQTYEMGVDIATKEYLDVLTKYNQSSLESGIGVKLTVIQQALPGTIQPSKKMLLVILAAVVSTVFCLVIFFLIFLLDRSVISPQQLAVKSDSPVLGTISDLTVDVVDLKEIWTTEDLPPSVLELKNQLRSLRYEVENDSKGKVLIVNSLSGNEGKTFMTISLAFAWAMTSKKVLVVDGNFNSPKISSFSNSSGYVEDFLNGRSFLEVTSEPITILKNKGGDVSLMEVATQKQIEHALNQARNLFDLIIIETASLNVVNQSKEWISFADNILAVFKHGKALTDSRKAHVAYLQKTGKFLGWVMNKIPAK